MLAARLRNALTVPQVRRRQARNRALNMKLGRRLIAGHIRDQRALAGSFVAELRVRFAELGRHVAQVAGSLPLEEALREAVSPAQGVSQAARVGPTGHTWVEHTLTVTDLEAWRRHNLMPMFSAKWLDIAQLTTNRINADIGLGVGLRDPVAARLIAEGGRRAGLVDLKQDTRKALYRVLGQARENQLGPIQIARAIEHEIPAGRFVHVGPRYRAELIARTEILSGQRRSSLETYRDAPSVQGVIAHDGLLGDTDDECEERDGAEMSFDEAEEADAGTHPNCTLNFSPNVPDILDTTQEI